MRRHIHPGFVVIFLATLVIPLPGVPGFMWWAMRQPGEIDASPPYIAPFVFFPPPLYKPPPFEETPSGRSYLNHATRGYTRITIHEQRMDDTRQLPMKVNPQGAMASDERQLEDELIAKLCDLKYEQRPDSRTFTRETRA